MTMFWTRVKTWWRALLGLADPQRRKAKHEAEAQKNVYPMW